jgi:hypothetical protein
MDPTNKTAWSENTGWVNAAPAHGGVTVCYDGTQGYVKGFAWGENIGWIKLGNGSAGPYANAGASDWGVNLDAASNLAGYAWGENVGWIKFDPAHGGVTLDKATGRFDGNVWGEAIGWVRFKGADPAYLVRTTVFEAQPQGTPNWWLENYAVAEADDEGDGIPAWQEYVADTDPTNAASYFRITAMDNPPLAKVHFPSSSSRYYTLQRRQDLLTGSWTNVTGQTGIQGAGGLDSLHETEDAEQQFYRVEVRLSP